jgi:serine/threonine-protein kinase PknG
VISADDEDSPVYGTVGYQAPEIAEQGPSVGSDLYTVARTLAVLSFDFKGFTNTYRNRLPDRDKIPVLAAHESFYRLLRRATDPDPARRYHDAGDLAEQLIGVLREVLAADDGRPRPALSTLFGPEPHVIGPEPIHGFIAVPDPAALALALPVPLTDPTDPAASYLASLAASTPNQIVSALTIPPIQSIEVNLRLVRANIELGYVSSAHGELAGLDEGDWRVRWHRALAHLAGNELKAARRLFDDLYDVLPGEAAPKLALAACAERLNDLTTAVRLYETVWRTDHAYLGAAFGLARAYLARGDSGNAVNALEAVPATSSHYVEAQLAAVRAQVRDRPGLNQGDLVTAGARLEALELDAETTARHAAEVLEAALRWLAHTPPIGPMNGGRLLGADFTERALRFALERTYRTLARAAPSREERYALIDRANAARPHTLT